MEISTNTMNKLTNDEMLSIMYAWGFQISHVSHYIDVDDKVSISFHHPHFYGSIEPITYKNMDTAISNVYVRTSWLVYNDINTLLNNQKAKYAQSMGRALRHPTPVKIISL